MSAIRDFLQGAIIGAAISLSILASLIMMDRLGMKLSYDHETERKYREASAEVSKLRYRLSEMEKELSATETQLLEASSTHNETRKALQAAQKGNQEEMEKLAGERFTNHDARDELGTLRNTLNSTLAELASTHKTIESLTTSLATFQVEVQRLQTCLDTSEEQRKQEALMHQSWVRQFLTTNSVNMAETRNLQEQVASMRQRCDLWYSMYYSTHANMEGQIADMSSAMAAAHAENGKLVSHNEELERTLAEVRAKAEGLESDNARLRDEKWRLEGEWQSLRTELAECKASNRVLVGKWWEAVIEEEEEEEFEGDDDDEEHHDRESVEDDDDGDDEDDEDDDDDDDEDKVVSRDGGETCEAPKAPSPTPVVQLYWESDMDGDEDEEDGYEEDEYEYEFVDGADA